jgi:hypothetical protein
MNHALYLDLIPNNEKYFAVFVLASIYLTVLILTSIYWNKLGERGENYTSLMQPTILNHEPISANDTPTVGNTAK